MSDTKKELKLLKVVNIICFGFAVLALVLAFISDSKSMIFDGTYSLIQSFFILLSAKIFRLIATEPDDNYQFGYSAFEPFFIVIRTTILLTVNMGLLITSVKSIITGGYLVNGGIVIVYAIISIIFCFIVHVILRVNAKKLRSPILKAEAVSWLNDGFISVAVLVSFTVSELMDNWFSRYVDSFVTIIFIIALVPNLLKLILYNTRELLNCAPPEEIQKQIEKLAEKVFEPLDYELLDYSTSKQGRSLFCTLYIKVNREYSLKYLDGFRKKMAREVRKKWNWMDIDIIFSYDPEWIEISSPDYEKLQVD